MNLAKSYEFFKPEDLKGSRVHIIGCGATGSTLAENLARLGIANIALYDFDAVEGKNIANQMFAHRHIGMPKVEAVADIIVGINPDAAETLRLEPEGWHGQRLAGYVFLCVDNIDLRRKIAEENRLNPAIKAMFDFRLGLTDAQHYAADWSDSQSAKNFIKSMNFTHADVEDVRSACHEVLSVCPPIRVIVALGVANFMNFVKGHPVKYLILADAFDFEVNAFPET
jgi:molybdopterin/thiamine biosynthesis adenylyltransferase